MNGFLTPQATYNLEILIKMSKLKALPIKIHDKTSISGGRGQNTLLPRNCGKAKTRTGSGIAKSERVKTIKTPTLCVVASKNQQDSCLL